jgi:glycosyltransferase involved in cell wall biosynthesis
MLGYCIYDDSCEGHELRSFPAIADPEIIRDALTRECRASAEGILERTKLISQRRVLIVITTIAFGGAEAQAASLAIELKARGWQVAIACLVNPKVDVTHLKSQGFAVHSLNMSTGVPDIRGVFGLRSLIRSFQPDVVHCHMFHANLLGRITRLFCRIPVLICTAHNIKETSRRGGPTWHKELLYRVTDRLADQTTIICQAAFDRYVRVGAVPRKRLQVIPNGVDTAVFSRSEELRRSTREALGIGPEFTWLAVGRLVKQKDYPTLFRALALLDPMTFLVLIAGSGPLEGELRKECAEHGLSGNVRFCGSRKNILDLYNAADAFVMSSEFEGLSVALLEAASMELPAVVTRVGGNPEIVIDNLTGYLVPPRAPAQLAAALRRLMLASPGQRAAMSRAARQYCQQHYRLETIVNQWIELYGKYLSVPKFGLLARSDITAGPYKRV